MAWAQKDPYRPRIFLGAIILGVAIPLVIALFLQHISTRIWGFMEQTRKSKEENTEERIFNSFLKKIQREE